MTPSLEYLISSAHEWAFMTLEDLRQRAIAQDTGVAFTAIKNSVNGRRSMLAICVTGSVQIERTLSGMEIKGSTIPPDWKTTTLVQAFAGPCLSGRPMAFELFDEAKERKALALILADPNSIFIFESALKLPD